MANCQESPLKCLGRVGNLAMDKHPIQGGVVILLVTSCYRETGISSGWLGH